MTRAGARDRPRERLGRLGAAALGDGELLALVLGHGTRRAGALTLANLVLEAAGGLHGLAACSGNELQRVPGVGDARAAQVLAAVELGRRTLIRQPADRPQLLTPRDVAMFLLPEFGARPVEQFGVVLLDAKHRLVRTTVLTVGTLDRTGASSIPGRSFGKPPPRVQRASSCSIITLRAIRRRAPTISP